MALTQDDVRGIATYARIALTPDELPEMTSALNEALELVSPLLAYDLTDVEPTFHPIGGLVNVSRDDIPVPGLTTEEALVNAASTKDGAFRVPAILAREGSV